MDSIYDKIRFLVRYLNECTEAYDNGHPKITDEEYDNKYFELVQLEQETGLILSNSPTQTISYDVVNSLNKIEHNHKMLSLDKTKSVAEAVAFVKDKLFLSMCKMDGLTCSLTYRNGELVAAETRGNGLVGEDILHNARVLPSIPKHIPHKDELVIDGEIICTYKDFEEVGTGYKNPRNFAAGSIRLLSAQECAKRRLTFVAWEVMTPLFFEDGIEYRVDQKLDYLSSFGFTIVPFFVHRGDLMSEKIMSVFIEDMKLAAMKESFPIDGVVLKYADCAYGRSLGETTHHFKNALAYKFYDEVYLSTLKDIEWTMGRTGVLTPVAVFEPIEIEGSTVERASLHNISVMLETFHGTPWVGQSVEVFKANMIIPQIADAEDASDSLHYPELPFIEIPTICPVCGGETKHYTEVDSTVLHCSNPLCEGKLINRLDHFCGKKGLDMKGISKATLEKLIDWGWITDYVSIFNLADHRDEWIKKPGFGIKSVDKVLSAIEAGSHCEVHQFIAALGIPLIGSTASKELAKHFNSWEDFVSAAESGFAFYTLPNFGAEMHSNLTRFEYAEAKMLADNYIHFAEQVNEPAASGSDLTGKVFVITGKLTHFKNRDEIKSKIEALGGKVTGSVSKNTHYLINNDVNSGSSKNVTAKSLGIPVLSEDDFIQTFGIV